VSAKDVSSQSDAADGLPQSLRRLKEETTGQDTGSSVKHEVPKDDSSLVYSTRMQLVALLDLSDPPPVVRVLCAASRLPADPGHRDPRGGRPRHRGPQQQTRRGPAVCPTGQGKTYEWK